MEESAVWQEEDMDLLISYSTKPPSPVYSHRKRDPMGVPSSASAGGKKKLSYENLGAMFPHGKLVEQRMNSHAVERTCNIMLYTGSGDILAENFNPAWFLLEKHRFSSFEVRVILTHATCTVFVNTITV